MKITVTESMFIDAFARCGRENQFTTGARRALYDWYTQLEDDTGEEIELDPIGVCCEWAEYGSLDELRESYPEECEGCEDLADAADRFDDPALLTEDDTILVLQS